MKPFHCRVCGQNIGAEEHELVYGDGVCDACQPDLCEECKKEGRTVKKEDCSFHNQVEESIRL